VGIITLPNGKHLAVVVYIMNTAASTADAEAVIASISKLAYDHYAKKKK